MKRIVEIQWKIGDEPGVPSENLKSRLYRFEVPERWTPDMGWDGQRIIQAATMELAKEAYNALGILNVDIRTAILKTVDAKK